MSVQYEGRFGSPPNSREAREIVRAYAREELGRERLNVHELFHVQGGETWVLVGAQDGPPAAAFILDYYGNVIADSELVEQYRQARNEAARKGML